MTVNKVVSEQRENARRTGARKYWEPEACASAMKSCLPVGRTLRSDVSTSSGITAWPSTSITTAPSTVPTAWGNERSPAMILAPGAKRRAKRTASGLRSIPMTSR